MEVSDVAPALQERLESEATTGLLALFTIARQEWTTEVTTAAVERFERRLSDEIGALDANLRREVAAMDAGLRREIAGIRLEIGSLATRREIYDLGSEIRKEIASLGTDLRKDIASLRAEQMSSRFELVKWCFVFWVGQAIAVAGIVGVLLRLIQP